MECYVIDAIIALVAGFIGGLGSEGVRKMLALYVLPQKIHLGKILKSEPSEERNLPYWYVSVSVCANPFWNLIASHIDDVKANIDFISRNTSITSTYRATWADLDDALLAHIGVGSEMRLRIATLFDGNITAVGTINQQDILKGDYDVSIELKSGKRSLRRWRYSKAVMNGQVQSIEPDSEVSNATS
jgi:hypothetical protein